MKRPAPRVMVCWVEYADERCAVCGELLNPNFGKKPKYWMQYQIVEPMLVDGVKLCDKTIKPDCLYTYLDQNPIIPVGKAAVFRDIKAMLSKLEISHDRLVQFWTDPQN